MSNAPRTDDQPTVFATTIPQPKGNDLSTTTTTNQVVRAAGTGSLPLASPATPAVAPAENDPVPIVTLGAADQLIGAWVLVGTPDHVGKVPSAGGRIKFFTGTDWCITQSDAKTGVVLFHHGGTYSVNGDILHANLDFANSSTVEMIGQTNGNFTFKIDGDTMTSMGVDNPWKEVWKRMKTPASMASPLAKNLTGTWAYAGKPGETNAVPDANRLKFCAGGYWCDSDIDPGTHVVTVHHGGVCSLEGDQYVETCKYANPTTMKLIGADVKFSIKIEGDTLTLNGKNNPWDEVWKRLD
jgi:hypothetical protein